MGLQLVTPCKYENERKRLLDYSSFSLQFLFKRYSINVTGLAGILRLSHSGFPEMFAHAW